VRLRLSPRVSYTRSKAVPIDTRNIAEYPAERHSIRQVGAWCNSLNGL